MLCCSSFLQTGVFTVSAETETEVSQEAVQEPMAVEKTEEELIAETVADPSLALEIKPVSYTHLFVKARCGQFYLVMKRIIQLCPCRRSTQLQELISIVILKQLPLSPDVQTTIW